jgi:hypothetical protein
MLTLSVAACSFELSLLKQALHTPAISVRISGGTGALLASGTL